MPLVRVVRVTPVIRVIGLFGSFGSLKPCPQNNPPPGFWRFQMVIVIFGDSGPNEAMILKYYDTMILVKLKTVVLLK